MSTKEEKIAAMYWQDCKDIFLIGRWSVSHGMGRTKTTLLSLIVDVSEQRQEWRQNNPDKPLPIYLQPNIIPEAHERT